MTEIELVKKVIKHLLGRKYVVRREIPNMGRSVDLVAQKGRWLTFVEVKVSNWKRALEQCQYHEQVADYIFIAIATKEISPKFMDIAKEKGYGILHFNKVTGKCKVILEARSNKKIWRPQREILFKKFRKIRIHGHTTLDDLRNIC